MRGFWAGFALAAGLATAALPARAQIQTSPPNPAAKPQPGAQSPASPSPPAQSPAAKPVQPPPAGAPPPGPPPGLSSTPGPNEPDQGAPGVPSDSATVMLDVPARTVAELTAKAKWDEGFKVVKDTEARVKAAAEKAGLKIIGAPIAVFTQEDDNGFGFTAMLPLAPGSKATLTDGVAIGASPAGKAIKFQHRGAYDDIDSTYDLITAYLDEKSLEAQDFFIEEYLTPLTSAEDPYLAVDIYVFLKP
ncbi:AraC family transcriptional regulator [Methylovirgula ligni]|uniref:Effector-binding domain-containing protein n=1 Tax=Methylovirgula ligni TaxID=569860 RepID=A0A3D9YQ83_9HYPH|nr:GyrI-like domain-containing protein [Methylovirgula ligni]QAY94829.1 AraC family transcriptional regulator [Methylovirgula ligni]REF84747.1 effector-binding domain-containing protein [Methylovirgula ligni]